MVRNTFKRQVKTALWEVKRRSGENLRVQAHSRNTGTSRACRHTCTCDRLKLSWAERLYLVES